MKEYIQLTRPFTLIAPLVGFLAGAAIGAGGIPPAVSFLGTLAASLLNAASNVINQVFDRQIDLINKPDRPIPAGKISISKAIVFSVILYLASILLAAVVNVYFFAIVIVTALITAAYSMPPLRLKRLFIVSNFAIALPRGCLLLVAGWASARFELADGWQGVLPFMDPEPWLLGIVLGLFVLGAASTKDIADIEGDRRFGCRTIPAVLGIRRSVLVITPFLVFPFVLVPIIVLLPAEPLLTGNKLILTFSGFFLSFWGCITALILLKNPSGLAGDGNHPSWWSMYFMLIIAQVLFALAYIIQ